MGRIRVLIADDQKLFAGSLKIVLQGYGDGEIEVVDIAENGRQAVALAEMHRPDLVLMDVRMPEMDGVEATRIIRERMPDVKIMILTTFDDDKYVMEGLGYGASGYILKNIAPEELVTSVAAIHAGTFLVSSSVGSKLVSQVSGGAVPGGRVAGKPVEMEVGCGEDAFPGPPIQAGEGAAILSRRYPGLSSREAEVLWLIACNYDNRDIANALFIAEQTVKNYASRIYAKIGVDNRPHAIQLALDALNRGSETNMRNHSICSD